MSLYSSRMAICSSCPQLKQLLGMDQCGRCSCMLAAKARLPTSKCPDNKWGTPLYNVYSVNGMVKQEGDVRYFTLEEASAFIEHNTDVKYDIIASAV
jgi:hypothetical protein